MEEDAELYPPIIEPGTDAEALADWMASGFPLEYCVSASFDPGFVSSLCHAGFLVMAGLVMRGPGSFIEILLPKQHLERMALTPTSMKAGRTTRRESRPYELSIDTDYEGVVGACVATHGEAWLRPPLLKALAAMRAAWRTAPECERRAIPRPLSVELWDPSGKLVAGEFGVLCGACYTSYSGFTRVSGAGRVQLYALGALLARSGCPLWDLGMYLPYKESLGARRMSRAEFLKAFRAAREVSLSLPPEIEAGGRMGARGLL